MEENEGKDLAQDMKNEVIETEKYYENVKLELSKIALDNVTIQEKHIKYSEDNVQRDVVEYGIFINFNDESIKIATIDETGKLIPNNEILADEKYTEEDKRKLGDMLNLLGLEQDKVELSKIKEQLKDIEAKTKEEFEQERKDKQKEDSIKDDDKKQDDEEKDDEQEEIDDAEKQEIAKTFNVDPKDVVHLDTSSEKITADENFSELVKWAEGRSNVCVVANKLGSIEKVVEKTDNGYEEVEHNMQQIHGDYPNIDIHLVGDDKINKIVPLKIYQIDSKTAFATIRNEWGELETIYCRKQEGEEKYWGSKVPEFSGKNVRQMEYDQRELMSSKYHSSMDLVDKAEEFEKAKELDNRGVPSGEEGIQVDEIHGNSTQNYEKRKEYIKEDLYKRKGIAEKMKGAMPGYANYMDKKIDEQADKILKLMEENKDMEYEQAVEQTDKEGQREEENEVEEEKVPWENRKR